MKNSDFLDLIDAQELPHPVTKVSSVFRGTALGRRVVTADAMATGKHGVRTIFCHHIDDADPRNGGWAAGTTTARTVQGNPMKGTFRVLIPEYVVQ